MNPPTKQINVRIPWELHLALANHKARTGQDKSEVIREGIQIVLDRSKPSAAIVAERALAKVTERITDLPEPSPGDLNGAGGTGIGSAVAPPAAQPPPAPEVATVHLPAWLQGRTGMPRSIMRRRVVQGAVTIDGKRCQELDVDPAMLAGDVRLEGQPV